ncbi:FMN-linked oxidoreductase [Auriscalpium vulgare]|uniref:FMN-linked oxidoreductase n=2 Tax=Auriscalpium vulgare TaxID=40419 RepID=A0ACB8R6Q7_9AGAM|nr:FMN-linked oxidoreductase [Auriscalpium vulgare]KAI0039834.1 FMN-linked oxidoreductase [Auriscalpium vulgare]
MSKIDPNPLFTPLQLGPLALAHRIVLPPLTRMRAGPAGVPTPAARTYYAQRACAPGTLLITEGTFISADAGGYAGVPGVWDDEMVGAWKEVADAVHAKGSYVFMQLWALGRAADPTVLAAEGHALVGPSAVPLEGFPVPRALTSDEIRAYIRQYAEAAGRAVEEAGCDGVEVHAANGYLLDQFLHDTANARDDEWGGGVEGRIRFAWEVVKAVVERVGEERVGVRVSPWSRFQGMRMEDPLPTFLALVDKIKAAYPGFAYLHVVEPRIAGSEDDAMVPAAGSVETNDALRAAWAPGVVISTGGYDVARAAEAVRQHGGLIGMGRAFIANPDLVHRLRAGLALNEYDRTTFMTVGDKGYTDYAFADAAGNVSGEW